jgi:hypothetical protein
MPTRTVTVAFDFLTMVPQIEMVLKYPLQQIRSLKQECEAGIIF